jgi:hypothetical protein
MTDDTPDATSNTSKSGADDATASSHGASGGPIELDVGDAGDRSLWIPPDATREEAAAIAATIAAYLSDRERADATAQSDDRDRWAFAGRIASIGRQSERAPSNAPRDPWTSSGRTDRF